MLPFGIVTALALGFGLLFTWAARALARRARLVDSPDGRRKIQTGPVAVVGGLALYASTSVSLLAACAFSDEVATALAGELRAALALLVAAAIIAAVGLADDVYDLRARYKLLGQLAAIAVLVFGGDFAIDHISFFGIGGSLGYFAIPVTILWFLAAVNALNLLDGMDGMLGSVGATICITLAAVAYAHGHLLEAFAATALLGGLIGFLRFNFPPATVYLGDCGSMLVGLTIAALATHASVKGPTVAVASPLALLALPFADTAAAIVRRKLTGRGIATADRGHLHHVLQKRGLTRGRALVLVTALCGIASLGALASTFLHNDLAAVGSAVCIGTILVSGGLFGAAEIKLIRERGRSFFANLRGRSSPVEMEVRLQGTADWGEVWTGIARCAEGLNLDTVCLDVNAPAWHEGYHRRWARGGAAEGDESSVWRVELPLFGNGQILGRLSVSGSHDRECIAEKLATLSRLVEQAEALASAISLPAALASRRTAIPTSETIPASA